MVLRKLKEIQRREHKTLGQVASELLARVIGSETADEELPGAHVVALMHETRRRDHLQPRPRLPEVRWHHRGRSVRRAVLGRVRPLSIGVSERSLPVGAQWEGEAGVGGADTLAVGISFE